MKRKKLATFLTVMMCLVAVTAGCEKKDDKASKDATEATEPATEISLQTADVEPVPLPEPEPVPEPEPEPLPAVSEDAAEIATEVVVDEFGITDMDEIKLYATEKVRMRTEPNTEGDNISGTLNAGDEVTANGKSGEWHRIKKGDKVLYVKSEYLTDVKPEKTEDSASANAAAAATTDTTAAAAQAATDAAAQQTAAAQQAAALQAATQQQATQNQTPTETATNSTTTDATTTTATTAQTPTPTLPAATGLPSWATPGDSGISAADCVTIYNYWKNNKGQDDATIQSYWGSLTNHYAGHGTAGW
jgi:type II secretory pathway pseudopilin PulG